jgi:hypothetical protein
MGRTMGLPVCAIARTMALSWRATFPSRTNVFYVLSVNGLESANDA